MSWPAPSDYQDALQNARSCFQDPELQAGSVSLTPLGLPRVATGNFASVYEVRNGTRRWAVRCFLRQVSDQQHHYALLSDHLAALWLSSLVRFEYLPQGVRVRGQWYPIVKMEWVEGEALHTFVQRHLNDPKSLLNAAAQWRGLVNSMRGSHLAHGDLQHGNVLVTPQGQMRLVDYDTMFVPAARGMRSRELGHFNYQHYQRTPDDYDEGLDNFAALVVYTSLRALAVEPELWQPFHTGENLILSGGDYKAPQQSATLQRLKRNPSADVRELAVQLERCCLAPVAQVPVFETVVGGLSTARQPARPSPVATAVAVPVVSTTGNGPSPAAPAPAVPWWQTTLAQLRPSGPSAPPPAPSKTAGQRTSVRTPATSPSRVTPAKVAAPVIVSAHQGPAPTLLCALERHSYAARSVVFSPDGRCVATGGSSTKVGVWDAQTGKLLQKLAARTGSVNSVAFSPDGKLLVSGADDHTVRLWDVQTGKRLRTLSGHHGPVFSVAFSPDGATIASGGGDHLVKLWNAQTGELKGELAEHNDCVHSVAFSPDGTTLVSGSDDHKVRRWDALTGKRLRTLAGHSDWVKSVTYSPDGKTIASAGDDQKVRLWDAQTGHRLRTLPGHTGYVNSVAFSPDGRTLASGSADKTARLWDVPTGTLRCLLNGHSDAVASVAFSPGGRLLVTGSNDRSVKVWRIW